jgi:hypothetical protein
MDFSTLRKTQKGNNTFEALAKKAEEAKGGSYEKDPRYFVPKVDKDGNGTVVLRFLPHAAADGVDYADYVTLYKHAFKDEATGQWYIENSRTTLPDPNSKYGMPDPVSDANRALFTELGKDAAIAYLRQAKRNRQTKYISNVLVIKNELDPDTVGGVYLYEYGQKILDKILAKTKKDDEDSVAFDAFNMWEGANFRLKMKKKDGQRNYDDSEFDAPKPLYGGDDEKLEAVYNKLHSLSAEIAPDKFKSYDELQKRFLAVTTGTKAKTAEQSSPSPKEYGDSSEDKEKAESTPASTGKAAPPDMTKAASSSYFDDTDDIPFN